MDINQSVNAGVTAKFISSCNIEELLGKDEYFGSGSSFNFTEFNTSKSGSTGPLTIEYIEPPSVVEGIQDEVMDIFSINMSNLADACGVSRKTLYNWRIDCKTISRRKKGMDRLFKLSEAARNWRNSGYPQPAGLLREPMVNGKSLYDLLVAKPLDIEVVQSLGARLAMRQLGSVELIKPFG